MELRRRGYSVTIGKVGAAEVGFVATQQESILHIQVATTIVLSEGTRHREYAPLEAISDNHPKFVLTLDPMAGGNIAGIRHLRVPDFLLSNEF